MLYFQAYIRYDKENQAKEALDKANEAMNDEITLNGNKLETRVLEGNFRLTQVQSFCRGYINISAFYASTLLDLGAYTFWPARLFVRPFVYLKKLLASSFY